MNKDEKTENKYQRGKIYKIVSFQTDEVYVGSTCEPYLCNRLSKHRCNYRAYQRGKYHYVTSFELVKYVDADVILLENYPCNNKQELHARERHYIESLNCVNMVIPTRSQQEYGKVYEKTEKAKAYRKDYQKTDKVKRYRSKFYSQKVECECGSVVTRGKLPTHKKSAKHLKLTQKETI